MPSAFGRLHIPWKQWSLAANLPAAYQAEQNWKRIEDWADRLLDRVGAVGGVPLYVNGKRYEETVAHDSASWTASWPSQTSITLLDPKTAAGETGRLWIVYVSAVFDFEILAVSDVSSAFRLDFECKVEPTTTTAYSSAFIAPISKQTYTSTLGTFDSDTMTTSIPTEWMMVCYLQTDEVPEGEDIPAVTIVDLMPEATVTLEVPGGSPESTLLSSVDCKAVVHALVLQDPNVTMDPVATPPYIPDPTDGDRIPGYTVKHAGIPPDPEGGLWIFDSNNWDTSNNWDPALGWSFGGNSVRQPPPSVIAFDHALLGSNVDRGWEVGRATVGTWVTTLDGGPEIEISNLGYIIRAYDEDDLDPHDYNISAELTMLFSGQKDTVTTTVQVRMGFATTTNPTSSGQWIDRTGWTTGLSSSSDPQDFVISIPAVTLGPYDQAALNTTMQPESGWTGPGSGEWIVWAIESARIVVERV